ncbi:MAG: DNA primase [Acidimicrobiia bacterium]|nr:DNA primase [Acidimicrobiia bacterium]
MAYSTDDKERVRERTDLAELAAEVTRVKRSGRTVTAICPFHDEKTPSLSIDPGRGLFYCFGCGKSGDVFTWVEETQAVDFRDALEILARRAGITLTESAGEERRRGRRELLVAAVTDAVAFYHQRLNDGPDAAGARRYLRGRGYDGDIVSRFSIGYSPADWEALVTYLGERGHTPATIQQAGLGSRSNRGNLVDRFRGRLMFPINDLRGDPVGFGARVLDGDGPKYLNSPETPIYHKGRLLFGLDRAKSEIVRRDRAVVVEGYTDVMAFHLAGHPVAVATCGTALGDDHLDILRRFTSRVVLAFDADAAGAGAARRGFDRSIPGDLDLRMASFPDGRDPADLQQAGMGDQLIAAVEASVPLLQYRIDGELDGYDMAEAEAKVRAATAAARLIALHPDPTVRADYVTRVARRTGVAPEVIARAAHPAGTVPGAAVATEEAPPSGRARAERELLRLVLANDPGLRRHHPDPGWFEVPAYRTGFELVGPAIAALEPGEVPSLGRLLDGADEPTASLLSQLALEPHPLGGADEVVRKLRLVRVEAEVSRLRRAIEAASASGEDAAELVAERISLQKERDRIRSAAVD